MQQLNENIAIKNFIVFQDLMFHGIMLRIQHTPRLIAQSLRASWHLPKEKAVYAYLHYQLSLLPFRQKMELIQPLQAIILRTSLFHVRRSALMEESKHTLFLDLLSAELNAELGQQENFRAIIRNFNYGFILLSTENIFAASNPTEEEIEIWADWYYLGLKEFLYGTLEHQKNEVVELLFTVSFLKQYLMIAAETIPLTQCYESKYKELLNQAKGTSFYPFVLLLKAQPKNSVRR